MIILYVSLAVLALWGVQYKRNGFNNAFDRDLTNAVRGFFIGWVFLRHCQGYVDAGGYVYSGIGDWIIKTVNGLSRELIVVMFLFYSGYGVLFSLKTKGDEYVRKFPKKRILTTLVNFDIAVLVFAIVDLLLGITLSWRKFVFSLLCWDSIGNSNWYIFAILMCYIMSFIASICFPRKYVAWGVAVLVMLCAFTISFFKPSWWYNTMMVFPVGGLCAYYQDEIEAFVGRRYWYVLCSATGLFFVTLFCFYFRIFCHPGLYGFCDSIVAISFAVCICLGTMKFKLGNAAIVWLGKHVFPLYIYQRIPMLVLSKWFDGHMSGNYLCVYMCCCILTTLAIAVGYRSFEVKFK